MMMFRAAVIGCGKIGSEFADDPRGQGVRSHAEAYRACPSTRLIALCDTDTEKLERCGRRWDVRAVYVEPLQLLSEMQPEIVSVCTPDDTHYELIRQCVSSPHVRAVLAEKPLALTLAHAEELDRLSGGYSLRSIIAAAMREVSSASETFSGREELVAFKRWEATTRREHFITGLIGLIWLGTWWVR
jgi:predicted dehydrogenase